jgi:hypothetical protein
VQTWWLAAWSERGADSGSWPLTVTHHPNTLIQLRLIRFANKASYPSPSREKGQNRLASSALRLRGFVRVRVAHPVHPGGRPAKAQSASLV